jgi:hypothetical protein
MEALEIARVTPVIGTSSCILGRNFSLAAQNSPFRFRLLEPWPKILSEPKGAS